MNWESMEKFVKLILVTYCSRPWIKDDGVFGHEEENVVERR